MKRLIKHSEIDKNISLENKLKQLKDIIIHKEYIIESCGILAKYLFKTGRENEALDLMKRAFSHDISKLSDSEFYGMAKYVNEMGLKNTNNDISTEKEKYINMHRNKNKHHPEYWDSPTEMYELDIMELVCDWFARSTQFNTNAIEFLYSQQETRFHFPKEIFNKIEKYLNILIQEKER